MWFYAIFLFTTFKHGASCKELQRQIGLAYKTVWRTITLIRKHMAEVDGEAPMGGKVKVVKVDEIFVGGKTTGMDWRKRKTVVMGMMERDGDVLLKVVPDQSRGALIPELRKNVVEGSEVHTDELRSYRGANMEGYTHKTVNHSDDEYVGPNGETTNSIENFFGHLKRSLKGTHNNVSPKYLEAYVKEFEYRFNRRTTPEVMLGELLSRFPELNA